MKTLILLLALSPIAVGAQEFVYDISSEIADTIPSESYTNVGMYFTTPTPEAIRFDWELVSNTFPVGWNYSLCDHTSCYTGIPNDGMMTPITLDQSIAGTKGFFIVTTNPGLIYGTGVVEIYVYDSNDYSRGDTVSFTITNLNNLSIPEPTLNVSIYPNPASEFMSLTNNSNDAFSYELFSVVGSLLQNGNVAANSSKKLDVAELPKGVYFIKITSSAGIRRTEKIIVR